MSIYSIRQRLDRKIEILLLRLRVTRLRRRHVFITYGKDLQWIGLPRLQLANNTELRIGAKCILRSKPSSNPIGIDHPVTFYTLFPNAKIVIGDNVGISGGSICARQLIEIGAGTLIGANTYIFDNDFHPTDPIARANNDDALVRTAPVRIGSNVFIGARSVILKGVTIGDNTVIGAGSVVSQNIPSNVIAAGNPCMVRSQLAV